MKRFAITGMGRSGTLFLSQCMNKSETWTVLHEPKNSLRRRFSREMYGEVNGNLLYCNLRKLGLDARGVLIRDPVDIFISAMARKPNRNLFEMVDYLLKGINRINYLVDKGFKPILFCKITTEEDYLDECIKFFGITDVDVSKIDLTIPVNKAEGPYLNSLSDYSLTRRQKAGIEKASEKFKDRHGFL